MFSLFCFLELFIKSNENAKMVADAYLLTTDQQPMLGSALLIFELLLLSRFTTYKEIFVWKKGLCCIHFHYF